MNKYIIPICDIQAGSIWTHVIMAKSRSDCEEKLINKLIELYDVLDNFNTYREFVENADEHDILIGDITDIEEL
jgi:hypothetical protein